MENRANNFDRATSDSINSEFFHEIYFQGKQNPLPGYSGKVGYREKKVSSNNFLNYVLRLMKRGYYPGSWRHIVGIIYYKSEDDDRVVRMYPEKAIWESKFLLDPTWTKTIKSIDVMYDLIKQRWPLEKIQDHLMIKRKVKEFFNPHDLSQKHTDVNTLIAYCKDLIQDGYPRGEVEHYHRLYSEKYFTKK